MPLLSLTDLRERAAQVLAPASDDDPPVIAAPVDAIEPPALIVGWDDPWLEFRAPCFWDARLIVFCFAGRIEPDAGFAKLEELVTYVIQRFKADAYSWPHNTTRAPRALDIGGINLLVADVVYACPVSIGGG